MRRAGSIIKVGLRSCILGAMLSAIVVGQSNESKPKPAATPTPPKQLKIGGVDFSGNLRARIENYGQLRIKPHSIVTLRADVRHLRLSRANDLWYSGGGAFQEGTFGYAGRPSGGNRSLGTLFDISADIVITPTTVLTFYGAGVRGGGVQSFIHPTGGRNPTARFVYAEVTKRF
jgi:hypothetical protein